MKVVGVFFVLSLLLQSIHGQNDYAEYARGKCSCYLNIVFLCWTVHFLYAYHPFAYLYPH